MPQFSVEVPHTLGQEEASKRLKHRLDIASEFYQSKVNALNHQWNGHTLSFGFEAMGMKIAGTMAVDQQSVKVAANLPLAAVLFKKTIEERIRQEVGKMLTS
jgi:hypothetical protein